eukprot:3871721-Rhodomonas_salina.1
MALCRSVLYKGKGGASVLTLWYGATGRAALVRASAWRGRRTYGQLRQAYDHVVRALPLSAYARCRRRSPVLTFGCGTNRSLIGRPMTGWLHWGNENDGGFLNPAVRFLVVDFALYSSPRYTNLIESAMSLVGEFKDKKSQRTRLARFLVLDFALLHRCLWGVASDFACAGGTQWNPAVVNPAENKKSWGR